MKKSEYKSYDDLPLFLNSETVAKVLGVSPSSGYELMHEPGFPVLRIGNRMVVPKEQFIQLPPTPSPAAWTPRPSRAFWGTPTPASPWTPTPM